MTEYQGSLNIEPSASEESAIERLVDQGMFSYEDAYRKIIGEDRTHQMNEALVSTAFESEADPLAILDAPTVSNGVFTRLDERAENFQKLTEAHAYLNKYEGGKKVGSYNGHPRQFEVSVSLDGMAHKAMHMKRQRQEAFAKLAKFDELKREGFSPSELYDAEDYMGRVNTALQQKGPQGQKNRYKVVSTSARTAKRQMP